MEKKYEIDRIRDLTENEALKLADSVETIKDHKIYFADFSVKNGYSGAFGYSCLVFWNGKHIDFADDFELHHSGKTRAELHDLYMEKLNRILFTEEEILQPIKSYEEYTRKYAFLRDHYAKRAENVSGFQILHNEDETEQYRKKTSSMIFDRVSYAYYNDVDFVRHHVELADALENARKIAEQDYDYIKSAFYYEMCNHEYAINWQGDFDVLSCFGNLHYIRSGEGNEIAGYFDQLDFTDTQRRAYMDARRAYMEDADKKGWI